MSGRSGNHDGFDDERQDLTYLTSEKDISVCLDRGSRKFVSTGKGWQGTREGSFWDGIMETLLGHWDFSLRM
jgi:hypothetical protein